MRPDSLPSSQVSPPRPAFKGAAAIIALLCLTGDAQAQDRATFCDGLGRVTVAPDGDDYAVSITNPYCNGGVFDDLLDVVPVEIDGLHIVVQLWSEPGNTPDTAVILPPDGWISIPPEITLREFETGRVALVRMGLS